MSRMTHTGAPVLWEPAKSGVVGTGQKRLGRPSAAADVASRALPASIRGRTLTSATPLGNTNR